MNAATVHQLAEAVDVRSLIRGHLAASAEADPHVLAAEMADSLGEVEMRAIIQEALSALYRQQIRAERRPNVSVGSSRWDNVAALRPELEVFRLRVYCGEWKMLGECSADDVRVLADLSSARAEAERIIAARWQKLEATLRRKRKATLVSDLDPATVAEVLHA